MSASSSSSSSSQQPWIPSSRALWVCQDLKYDQGQAFTKTLANFDARMEALRASGVAVVQRVFELYSKVAECLRDEFPSGVDILGLRMHANETTLPLSPDSGGSYSLTDTGEPLETVQAIFGNVRKFLMIEGCKTGFEKNGILKKAVSLCPPGVIGIGSKGSVFEVSFDPILSGYMRFECLQSKQDATRIYYKTEKGVVQNIPVDEMMLLWDVFKEKCNTPEEKQRAFELCYKLLGERNDPETFARIRNENRAFINPLLDDFETIRKMMLQVKVVKPGAKAVWREMLTQLENMKGEISGYQGPAEIPMDEKERAKTEDRVVKARGRLKVANWTPYQKVYLFLLGCAFIDKYKTFLMLLDDETEYGPASKAIKALSALTVHGSDRLSITTILTYYFPVIKRSYRIARESFLLQKWFDGISKRVCFNDCIKFIDAFYEEKIRPSKEDRLRIAVLKNQGDEVQKLIEDGVNLQDPTIEIQKLYQFARHRGFIFVSFLLYEQLNLMSLSKFIEGLKLDYHTNDPVILNQQVFFIAQYLSGKGKFKEAVLFANLITIRSQETRFHAFCACAKGAAVLGEIVEAAKILNFFLHKVEAGCGEDFLKKINPELTQTLNSIIEMAIKLEEFWGAVEVALIFIDRSERREALKKIFDDMVERGRFREVITLFTGRSRGNFLLIKLAKKMLAQGEYQLPIEIAESMQHHMLLTHARKQFVGKLLSESKLDDAFTEALKIPEFIVRETILFDIVTCSLKHNFPYLALDVARAIKYDVKRNDALRLVMQDFTQRDLPHLALKVAQEIEDHIN